MGPAPTHTRHPHRNRTARIARPTRAVLAAGILGDVQPGVYSTSGNPICSWSRLRNARHEQGSAIASGSVDGLVGFVTIQAGDANFETRGCEPWARVN